MNNRHFSAPILFVLTGSLFLPSLLSADPAADGSTTMVSLGPPVTSAAPPSTALIGTMPPDTYTVKKGESLWDVAHDCHTTVTKLKKANGMKTVHVKPGQLLLLPPGALPPPVKAVASLKKSKKNSPAKPATAIAYSHVPRAQEVQDFDLPAQTFASCPPPPTPAPDEEVAPTPEPVTTSVADSSPGAMEPSAEMNETDSAPTPAAAPAPVYPHATVATVPLPLSKRAPQTAPISSTTPAYSYSTTPVPPPAPVHHGLFSFFDRTPQPVASDWGSRFTQTARDLGNRDIDYDDAWCPPGESHSWAMDCSNTTRYLYRVTTGIELPRTASDQYYYLHLQNKAWDVPQTSNGFADCNYLRSSLKPGDLLFWENTYRPERQPPITHVMIFLGTNDRGNWIMAGSQSGRGGEHNRRHGGPDIYVFDPTKPCGGYTTWMGLVHHQGKFCAFGRPLEADKSKLAVAAND